jgi:hypothetical protein
MLHGEMARIRGLRTSTGWLGPLVLGAYFMWQFRSTWLVWRGDLVWAALVAMSVAVVWIVRRGRPSAVELMALEVLAASLYNDVDYSRAGALRDLRLYLDAGQSFLAGSSPYTTDVLQAYPADLSDLPFLYAPPILPFFALLSALPFPIVAAVWVAASATAVVASLRAFGLSWPWAVMSLAWFPIEQALYTGNVAAPSLLLLALAPALPSIVPVAAILKPQNAVFALWLIRQRDWRRLALGIAGLGALVALTLPLTGISLWYDWGRGLLAYQGSEQNFRSLYGVGLAKYLPLPVFIAIGVAATLLALAATGRIGLARLGLASVIASPSLWSHGFMFGIPAFLSLRATWLWLVAGLLSIGPFPGPQVALLIAALAWTVPSLRRDVPGGDAELAAPHPLGAAATPWPTMTAR